MFYKETNFSEVGMEFRILIEQISLNTYWNIHVAGFELVNHISVLVRLSIVCSRSCE